MDSAGIEHGTSFAVQDINSCFVNVASLDTALQGAWATRRAVQDTGTSSPFCSECFPFFSSLQIFIFLSGDSSAYNEVFK